MIFEDDKVPSYFVRTREAGYDEDQYNEMIKSMILMMILLHLKRG